MSEVGGIAKDQLKSFIDRVERLEEEMGNLRQDIKEVFDEAKASGFDVKTMRTVLRLKKVDPEERAQQEEMVKIYFDAID